MKKILLFNSVFTALLLIVFTNVNAVTHMISVGGISFTPNSMSVNVGDTVQWNWSNGSHTTTSTSVPGGAATWDSPMTQSVTVFKYKVTEAGVYNYKCTPHEGMGMTGSFTASTVTSVPNVSMEDISTSLYPNPFTNELFIDRGNEQPEFTKIAISDILGRQIRNLNIENLPVVFGKKRIDVGELPKGVYFVTLKGEGAKAKTIRLVKEGF